MKAKKVKIKNDFFDALQIMVGEVSTDATDLLQVYLATRAGISTKHLKKHYDIVVENNVATLQPKVTPDKPYTPQKCIEELKQFEMHLREKAENAETTAETLSYCKRAATLAFAIRHIRKINAMSTKDEIN